MQANGEHANRKAPPAGVADLLSVSANHFAFVLPRGNLIYIEISGGYMT